MCRLTRAYGVMRDYVLGVEAVLPTGEIIRSGGRLVSLWRGRFDLQPDRDGMEGSARVVVEGDPAFETIVRGDIFLDTYPPTGARAMAAVRPTPPVAPVEETKP